MAGAFALKLARDKARARTLYGEAVTISGKSYACVFGLPPRITGGEFLPDGGNNAADADDEIVNCSPEDFRAGPPAVGSPLTRDATGQGYTVKSVKWDVLGGVPVSLRLVVYRTPPPDSASDAPTGEPDAGRRKEYWPPDAPE